MKYMPFSKHVDRFTYNRHDRYTRMTMRVRDILNIYVLKVIKARALVIPLYYNILYCTALHSTVLYYTIRL